MKVFVPIAVAVSLIEYAVADESVSAGHGMDGRFQGTKIVGAQPYAVFDEKIRALSDRH